MNVKVSIIVPIYNTEKYIDRAMNSILNQTLKEIEIVLVDDESPDKCPQICDEYAKKDSRIKVIHKKNEGLGYARNSGLNLATGEYVMFLDSDDHIKLDACEKLYNIACEHNADVVAGGFITEVKKGTWVEYRKKEIEKYKDKEIKEYILDMIASAPKIKAERLHPVSVCLLCIKKKIIDDNNLKFKSEREVASEDTLFKINLLNCIKVLVETPYNFYYYHLNGNSLTHTFKMQDFERLYPLRNNLIKYTGNDNRAIQRINRFIISDVRMQILRLVTSDRKDKIKVLKLMVNDNIWNELKSYDSKNFSIYPRLFYKLCLSKKTYLLYILSLVISFIKKYYKR